jgi:hypothetical protein
VSAWPSKVAYPAVLVGVSLQVQVQQRHAFVPGNISFSYLRNAAGIFIVDFPAGGGSIHRRPSLRSC